MRGGVEDPESEMRSMEGARPWGMRRDTTWGYYLKAEHRSCCAYGGGREGARNIACGM